MWNYKIKRVSVLSVFKFTLLYGIIIGAVFSFIGGLLGSIGDAKFFGMGIFGGLIFGIIYGIILSLFSTFGTWLFNLISGIIDGIDIELVKRDE
ncbi:hypothetical protein EDC21_10351 [Thermohydrogenium kirishiense]|nr:hypothetical protein EDC21_10351 [Thermohydrogenium kirishiense]